MNAVIDRLVQYPNRFQLTNISDGTVLGTFDLSPVTGTVSVVGTILNHDLFQSIADDLASRVKTEGGVVSNTTETFTMAGTRTNISSGETISVSFGKIAKIINDLKAVAFSGNKADIGLGNVDNTSDASKPVSTATQTALDAKVDKADASSTYMPLSGGRLTGDLAVGNTTIFASGSNGGLNSIQVGDDAYLGDCDVGGHIGVRSRSSYVSSGFQFYIPDSQGSKDLGRITFSLSGTEISTTYSGLNMPVLTCTGNTDGLWSYGVASLYPNLSAGNNVYCPIGVKYSLNDCIGMGFHYTADGSASNYFFIKAFGSSSHIVDFFADMHSEFAGYSVFTGYVQSAYYTSDNTCHIKASDSHEITIDTNDGQIWFNYANRLDMGLAATDYYFGTDGNSPTQTLANVHAKTFTGDLSGTAEKAVNDTNGASITSTYLSKADASSTYLPKADASSTYVEKSSLTSAPTENSTNPITSGGVYTAVAEANQSATEGLAKKLDKGDWMEYQFDYVKNTDIAVSISQNLENGTYICEILARGTGDSSDLMTCYPLGVFSVYGETQVFLHAEVFVDGVIHNLSAYIDAAIVTVRGDLDSLQVIYGGPYVSILRFRKIADD